MSKSRKQILQELLDLENENLGTLEEPIKKEEINNETENGVINKTEDVLNDTTITKPKKKLTEKQLQALKKGQETRDANARKRKEEAEKLAEEEKKKLEEKIVKKAISIKKKQIKKQAILDEIEDDNTPIQKIKEIVKGGSTDGFKGGSPDGFKSEPKVENKIIFF